MREYYNSPLELYVAIATGDEIPSMRDDLIARKNSGEDFLTRHFNAWTTPTNWIIDPYNDYKEIHL